MLRLIRLTIGILFVFLAYYPRTAGAQTIAATTCSSTDVQAAFNKVAADGTTVVIPAGTCTWTSPVTYNQVFSTTIQGQTTCIGSGSPGLNNLVCSDNTLILNGVNSTQDRGTFIINTVAGKSFRLTGISMTTGGGSLSYNGPLRISGSSTQVRVDHNHLYLMPKIEIGVFGTLRGVFDHNIIQGTSGSGWTHHGDSGNGDAPWAAPTNFGGSNFVFFEDNLLLDASDDCTQGGRWVVRYNTMIGFNGSEPLQTHPTGGAGRYRGCRAWEVYKNTVSHPSPCGTLCGDVMMFISSGTGLIWGNTVLGAPSNAANGFKSFVTIHSMRRNANTYQETATPNGWGYCGTSFNGAGSNFDQNSNTPTGYRCMDQPGQGQGDLLSGSFPNVTNTATGCTASQPCAWPRQALEPVYAWTNAWTSSSSGAYWAVYETDALFNNSDFYLDVSPTANSTTGISNPSDGTSGVGSGLLSARPTTCTPKVAYWATDTNTLYQCSATNTWTSYYTPYTYPHPLTAGSGTPPSPPTGLQAIVN